MVSPVRWIAQGMLTLLRIRDTRLLHYWRVQGHLCTQQWSLEQFVRQRFRVQRENFHPHCRKLPIHGTRRSLCNMPGFPVGVFKGGVVTTALAVAQQLVLNVIEAHQSRVMRHCVLCHRQWDRQGQLLEREEFKRELRVVNWSTLGLRVVSAEQYKRCSTESKGRGSRLLWSTLSGDRVK